MTKELIQEFTLKISQANKSQMAVIIYEMLMIYLEEAKQAQEAGDRDGFRLGLRRAKACLHELMASLHFEYPISGNLLQLYAFADKQLTRADIRNSRAELEQVAAMTAKLHAAFESVSRQDTSAPVMANTQMVFAGLTYGRNRLTESLTDQGSNRGFRV